MPPAGLNPIAFQNRTGHNAAGSEVFYYFLSLWKESNQRKHTEETEVPSGSLLGALKVSFGNTRIGLKITASATILPAPGALRSEALLRAVSKCIRSIGSRRGVCLKRLKWKGDASRG